MKKNKRLIDLYYEWMEVGEINALGLCGATPRCYKKDIRLFRPTKYDMALLKEEGYRFRYWGYGELGGNIWDAALDFSHLRQAIVLFICAIHGEI